MGFKTIDKFVKGVATSIKTLDLKAATYFKDGKAVLNKLKDYIDKLEDFKGGTRGDVKILEGDIKEKILDVGVPKGATKSQVEQIQEAIKYGKDKGIKVEINIVK